MAYSSISVKKVVTYFNNPIEQGGFWLPNIQREFVWREEQIEKFFDSIMREYPIGLFIILKTKREIKFRRFVSTYSDGVNAIGDAEAISESQKLLVLDGQQRFQSLFIALNGSYNGKHLYFNVNSGCEVDNTGIKYNFKFLKEDEVDPYWVKVRDVINSEKKSNLNRRHIISSIKSKVGQELTEEIRTRIDDNLDQLINCFVTKDIICYEVLDDTKQDKVYTTDDMCEIVTRSNSVGSIFKKDDLMSALEVQNFSIL